MLFQNRILAQRARHQKGKYSQITKTPNRHCPFELERFRNQDYIKQLEVPSDTKTYMVLAGTGIVSHTTG